MIDWSKPIVFISDTGTLSLWREEGNVMLKLHHKESDTELSIALDEPANVAALMLLLGPLDSGGGSLECRFTREGYKATLYTNGDPR